MAKDFGMLIDPPDYGKMGVGINPMEQESKYGIGLGNGNDVSINGESCRQFWDAVLQTIIKICEPRPGGGGGPGCGTGADFMVSEEEIIL